MLSVEIWDRTRGTYRKLTMKKEFVRTKMDVRDVCGCGYGFVKNEVPTGKEYLADVGTVRHVDFTCGGCGKKKTIVAVNVLQEDGPDIGLFYPFALDCLELRHQIKLRGSLAHVN